MTDEERKQAEDVMADNGFNFALFELENEHSAKNLLNAFEAYALKVAEATKEMYPKEFVEWKDRYIIKCLGGWMFIYNSVIKPQFASYEEIFEYWKQNIKEDAKG